jgi:hypothetical protein
MPAQSGEGLKVLETRLSQRLLDAVVGHQPLYLLGPRNDFAALLALFEDAIDLHDGSLARMRDGSIYLGGLPEVVRMHADKRTSHVLIAGLNENWGAFSTPVPHRTVDWGAWQDHLFTAGCTPQMVRQYLDDPAVKAVVTPHHTVFWHPKILSIPVGISRTLMATLDESPHGVQRFLEPPAIKTQELLINNSGWQHRQVVNERVIANFGGRIDNSFGLPASEFVASVTGSRFVLCPSGLGWDTSRIWETLLLGSIPVVEYSEGWHTVLDDLPVLFVTNFDEVTPALLARAYPEILSRGDSFDFRKLTNVWWSQRISRLLDARPVQN